MNLGEKFITLRKKNELTLEELSRKSGVAIATLSRIENNQTAGTVRTHTRICEALGISLAELYSDINSTPSEEIMAIAPESAEAEVFTYDEKASYIILATSVSKKNMMPVLLSLEVGGKTHIEENPKQTEKFIFCLEGEIEVSVQDKTYQLKKSNSLYFKSHLAHQIRNIGNSKARCLVITSPVAL